MTEPAMNGLFSPAPNRDVRAMDGFLYSGNRHESFPRGLLLDRCLTPLERNAWLVLRLALSADGITAFPTYDQMAVYLTSMPCALRASHETVARALTMLRLTRWISLVRRRRNPKNGRMQGNLYVLHDSPLTPWEAMQLDAEYLGLVGKALSHASKSIRRVGTQVLKDISEDPMLRNKVLPYRLQILIARLAAQGWEGTPQEESDPQEGARHDSEDGQNPLLRNRADPASESEPGRNPRQTAVRNPKSDSTVRSTLYIKEVRTVPRAQEELRELRLPERFGKLKPEQQSGALTALEAVDAALHQAILDEWDARCRAASTVSCAVRNPAGYLFGIIQKALRGEFHAWAGKEPDNPLETPEAPENPAAKVQAEPKPVAEAKPASAEAAQKYLAQLKSILRQPRPP
jgi:hypothetical protein